MIAVKLPQADGGVMTVQVPDNFTSDQITSFIQSNRDQYVKAGASLDAFAPATAYTPSDAAAIANDAPTSMWPTNPLSNALVDALKTPMIGIKEAARAAGHLGVGVGESAVHNVVAGLSPSAPVEANPLTGAPVGVNTTAEIQRAASALANSADQGIDSVIGPTPAPTTWTSPIDPQWYARQAGQVAPILALRGALAPVYAALSESQYRRQAEAKGESPADASMAGLKAALFNLGAFKVMDKTLGKPGPFEGTTLPGMAGNKAVGAVKTAALLAGTTVGNKLVQGEKPSAQDVVDSAAGGLLLGGVTTPGMNVPLIMRNGMRAAVEAGVPETPTAPVESSAVSAGIEARAAARQAQLKALESPAPQITEPTHQIAPVVKDSLTTEPPTMPQEAPTVPEAQVPVAPPVVESPPAAARPITVYRGELPQVQGGKQLTGVQDIGGLMGLSERPPLAPFEFFTTDPKDAQHYAEQDSRIMESYRKRFGSDAEATSAFETLHGHNPRGNGEVRSQELTPKKTLDLTSSGPNITQWDIVKKVNEVLGHEPLPDKASWRDVPDDVMAEIEKYGLHSYMANEDGVGPTWGLSRNVQDMTGHELVRRNLRALEPNNVTGSLFAEWLDKHGFDSFSYMHDTPDGPVKHIAVLTGKPEEMSAKIPASKAAVSREAKLQEARQDLEIHKWGKDNADEFLTYDHDPDILAEAKRSLSKPAPAGARDYPETVFAKAQRERQQSQGSGGTSEPPPPSPPIGPPIESPQTPPRPIDGKATYDAMKAGQAEGDRVRMERLNKAKNRPRVGSRMTWARQILQSKDAYLEYVMNKFAKGTKAELNPVIRLNELEQSGGEPVVIMQHVMKDVVKPVVDSGLTQEQAVTNLGVYDETIRSMFERADIKNPHVNSPDEGQAVLDAMRAEIGDHAFNAIEAGHEAFNGIFQKILVPRLEKGGLLTPENLAYVKGNTDYRTFRSVDKLSETLVPPDLYANNAGMFAPIKAQHGMTGATTNPMVETIMKMTALMRASTMNLAKVQTVRALPDLMTDAVPVNAKPVWSKQASTEVGPMVARPEMKATDSGGTSTDIPMEPPTDAERALQSWYFKGYQEAPQEKPTFGSIDTGSFMVPTKDTGMSLVMYKEDGVPKGVYMASELAGSFERPKEASTAAKTAAMIANKLNTTPRQLFTTWNIGFGAWNLQRDAWESIKNLPGNPFLLPNRLLEQYPAALKAAYQMEMGQMPEVVERMMLGDRWIHTSKGYDIVDPETTYAKMQAEWGNDPSKPENFIQGIHKATLGQLEFANAVAERTGKISAEMYLDKYVPGISVAQKGEYIRCMSGSPNFVHGGLWKGPLNQAFLFYNPAIQALNGAAQAMKMNPGSYFTKQVLYTVVPTLARAAAYNGAFGPALQAQFQNIPDNDNSGKMTLPLGMTEDGKTVYGIFAQDQTSQAIQAVIWDLVTGPNISNEINALSQLSPAGQSRFSPILSLVFDAAQYAGSGNMFDAYHGKMALTDDVAKLNKLSAPEGQAVSWPYAAKYESDKYLSSIYRFQGNSPAQIQQEGSMWLRALGWPVFGPIASRFIRISDRGQSEQDNEIVQQMKQKQAGETVRRGEIVKQYINQNGSFDKEAVKQLWQNEGIGIGQKPSADRTRLKRIEQRLAPGTPEEKAKRGLSRQQQQEFDRIHNAQ